MSTATIRLRRVATLFTVTLLSISGCGSRGQLPEEITVQLPDGTETRVTLGSGVISLADTTWQFFATASTGQGAPFVTISFGPNGELEAFEDNTIAANIFGSTILFDGQRHNTTQPGLSYAAATYGAETSDANGFTFEGRLNAFIAGLEVASSTSTASGTFDPDDSDIMTGTFGYTITMTVTIPGIPFEDQEDEFGFIAHRVIE